MVIVPRIGTFVASTWLTSPDARALPVPKTLASSYRLQLSVSLVPCGPVTTACEIGDVGSRVAAARNYTTRESGTIQGWRQCRSRLSCRPGRPGWSSLAHCASCSCRTDCPRLSLRAHQPLRSDRTESDVGRRKGYARGQCEQVSAWRGDRSEAGNNAGGREGTNIQICPTKINRRLGSGIESGACNRDRVSAGIHLGVGDDWEELRLGLQC